MPPHDAAANPQVNDPAGRVRTGTLWLAAGGAVLVGTYWLRTAATTTAGRIVPLLLLLAGAYAAVTGLERILSGWRAARRAGDPEALQRTRRAAWVAVGVLAVLVAGGLAAWRARAPYWDAVRSLAAGQRAADTLRDVVERHVAVLQSGATGAQALASWKTSADQALRLREPFRASLAAARYLEGTATGALQSHARMDVAFYGLCLEWMDLYERIEGEAETVSMAEPPEDWGRLQDSIVDRIQALPRPDEAR